MESTAGPSWRRPHRVDRQATAAVTGPTPSLDVATARVAGSNSVCGVPIRASPTSSTPGPGCTWATHRVPWPSRSVRWRGPAATSGACSGRVANAHSETRNSGVPSTNSSGRRTSTPKTTRANPITVARVWAGVGRQLARTGASSSASSAGAVTGG